MPNLSASRASIIVYLVQQIATGLILLAALAAAGATVAGAFGWLPFLTLPLQFGDTVVPDGGMLIQAGLVVILLAMVASLPAARRVIALERSHRDFSICMSDVADAYRACHAADREGIFTLASEFDAVKERILYLRRHPELGHLEPDVLEAAAEMSQASHELAEIYSDDNVARARGFLQHRQEEIDLFAQRIEQARALAEDLRRHHASVKSEEDAMEGELARLERDYADILRDLGFTRRGGNVVTIPAKFAGE